MPARMLLMFAVCLLPAATATGQTIPFVGSPSPAAIVQRELLFREWQKVQAETRSLLVEFTFIHDDRVFQDRHEYTGTVKVLKRPDGTVLARYEFVSAKDPKKTFTALLVGEVVYLLDSEKKQASKIPLAKGEVLVSLAYFSPTLLLLDKPLAQKYLSLTPRRDRWYTYLGLKSRLPAKKGIFGLLTLPSHSNGRLVVVNEASDDIPRYMPRQLWMVDAARNELTWEVRRWRQNPSEGIKARDLESPENVPGWRVEEWPAKLDVSGKGQPEPRP